MLFLFQIMVFNRVRCMTSDMSLLIAAMRRSTELELQERVSAGWERVRAICLAALAVDRHPREPAPSLSNGAQQYRLSSIRSRKHFPFGFYSKMRTWYQVHCSAYDLILRFTPQQLQLLSVHARRVCRKRRRTSVSVVAGVGHALERSWNDERSLHLPASQLHFVGVGVFVVVVAVVAFAIFLGCILLSSRLAS